MVIFAVLFTIFLGDFPLVQHLKIQVKTRKFCLEGVVYKEISVMVSTLCFGDVLTKAVR
jgi:hypothetical protein